MGANHSKINDLCKRFTSLAYLISPTKYINSRLLDQLKNKTFPKKSSKNAILQIVRFQLASRSLFGCSVVAVCRVFSSLKSTRRGLVYYSVMHYLVPPLSLGWLLASVFKQEFHYSLTYLPTYVRTFVHYLLHATAATIMNVRRRHEGRNAAGTKSR